MCALTCRRVGVVLGGAVVLTICGGVGAAEVTPAWYSLVNGGGFNTGIADYYQHQNWDAAPASTWEKDGAAKAGWCAPVSFADVLYDFQTHGYTNLLPAASTAQPTWLASYSAFMPGIADSAFTVGYQKYIDSKGYGAGTATPLLVKSYTVTAGGKVSYTTPAPRVDPLAPAVPVPDVTLTKSAFDFTDIKLRAGSDLLYEVKAGTTAPWWDYHSMAVAGIQKGTGTVFLADPDSNKGSGAADSGWPNVIPAARKYVAADPLPMPAAPALNNQASYISYYAGITLNANNRNVTGVDPNGRYTGATMDRIREVKEQKTGFLFDGIRPDRGGDTQTTVAIETNKTINDMYFLPSKQMSSFTDLNALTGTSGSWTALLTTTDPFDTELYYGGVHFRLDSGIGITAADTSAQISLGTLSSFADTGWEVLFHYADTPSDEWDMEVLGGPGDPAVLPQVQVPEAGGAGVAVAVAMLGLGLRRRRVGT